MARKTQRQKLKDQENRILAKASVGDEPTFTEGHTLTNGEMMQALNWYNYMYSKDYDRGKKYLLEYYKKDKTMIKKINSIESLWMVQSYAYIARLLTRGYQFSDDVIARMEAKINEAASYRKAESKVNTEKTRTEKTPQQRFRDSLSDVIAEIEGMIDDEDEINMYEWLTARELGAKYGTAIADFYRPIAEELEEALLGKDKDLKEGYSHLTKKELKAHANLFRSIVDDAERFEDNKKVTRKPRVKRAVSADKKVKNLKFLSSSNEYQLKSIPPVNIVGSQELWVFDTRYRKLTKYVACDKMDLDVKGTSIINFDESKSETKTLRENKVKDLLSAVLSGGKRQLDTAWKSVTTKPQTPSPRINTSIVLLKASK